MRLTEGDILVVIALIKPNELMDILQGMKSFNNNFLVTKQCISINAIYDTCRIFLQIYVYKSYHFRSTSKLQRCCYHSVMKKCLSLKINTFRDHVVYINPLNAELNPICHLLILLGDLKFMGTCIVSIFQYISKKMQR
jgi:hypothetical protein